MSKLMRRILSGEQSTGKNQAKSWRLSLSPEYQRAMDELKQTNPEAWAPIKAYVSTLHAQFYWSRQGND